MTAFLRYGFVSFVLILRFTFTNYFLGAQDTGIEFTHFDNEEGFNNGSIVCIFQDREGFMWFGTYLGLYRYDGHNFKAFQPVQENPNTLINGHVRTLCQDTAGALFIGTFDGLCIYYPETDQFKQFKHDPDDPNSLSHNTVYKLFKDHTGAIWAGTWGGGLDKIERSVSRDDPDKKDENYRFIHFKAAAVENSLSSNKVIDIAETADGSLWIATQNGLNRYDKKTNQFHTYLHDPDNPKSISNNNVSSLCIDRKGNVWAGTWEYGLNMLDPESHEFVRFIHKPNDAFSLSHNIIMELYCDLSGTLWVGTWGGGLNKIEVMEEKNHTRQDSETGLSCRFIHYKNDKSNPSSISGNSIYAILEDRTGSMWVGTDWNGLNKFNKGQDKFRRIATIPGNPNSLVNNVVFSLLFDRHGLLWIGTQNGLNTYDSRTEKYTLYQHQPDNPYSLSHSEVRSVIEGSNGNIWIGTVQGLNLFDPVNKRFNRYFENVKQPGTTYILTLYEDKNGYLWLGTYTEGLLRFDPAAKTFKKYVHDPDNPMSISSNIIWAILEERDNRLLIGTEKGGLCEFDPATEEFSCHMHQADDPASISHNTVYALLEDSSGSYWVGTLGGLNKMIRNKAGELIFTQVTNNLVEGIVEDNEHLLWLLTDIGFCNFNPADSSVNVLSIGQTMQAPLFSINAIVPDKSSGEIYLGGIKGYYIFDPTRAVDKPLPPVTKITGLRLFNKTVNINEKINGRIMLPRSVTSMKKLVFSHKEYVIGIEYAALHYQSPRDNQYAYRLEGFDRDWNYVGNQQIATYTNLPPDRYTFMVKAANPGGIWNNEPTSVELLIRPAFWNTLIFRILLSVFFISIVISLIRRRIVILKRRQHELEGMVSDRTRELSLANTLLTEKQEEITLQNEELLKHRNELESLVADRTRELTIAKEKAEESDRLKSAFLTNMSHEVRTPMNAIVGFSSLLDDDMLDPEEKKSYITTIKNNSDTLLTIINDILDISLIEANQLKLNRENFCVDDMLIELKQFYDLKNDKGLAIEVCHDPPGPKLFLYNDPYRLRQVLVNLLNNACKFTETGSIRYGYKTGAKMVRFFVEDTGIGISETNKKRIFSDFHKIEPSANRFYQGTGIGLALTKRLVNIMGGEISIESQLGKGSVVYFTLPDQAGPTDLPESKPEKQDTIKLDNFTFIVAEDEADNYLLVEKLLNKTGASIVWAHDGLEAVHYVEEIRGRNCLVLMDIKMPVMNGIEACAIIKEINSLIPVIAITAFAQKEDKENLLKQHFDDFIAKPLNFEKLWETISRHLVNNPEDL